MSKVDITEKDQTEIDQLDWIGTEIGLDVIQHIMNQLHSLPDSKTDKTILDRLDYQRSLCHAIQSRRFELVDRQK